MVGVEEPAAVEGKSVAWREPDRLVEVGERMVEIALGHIRDAAAVKRRRGIRNEADRAVVIGDGAVKIAGVDIGDAAVIRSSARLVPLKRPDFIAWVHPAICSVQGISGLPVHFKSRHDCPCAGMVNKASARASAASAAALQCRAKTMANSHHKS